jgi:ADP-ribosylglycohydrolase
LHIFKAYSDTIARITGGMTTAFYKNIPQTIIETVSSKLPDGFES